MAQTATEFTTLMEGVRQGSESAARLLVSKYGHHLARVVRKVLDKKMRSKYDAEDVTQSVWASFFARPAEQRAFDTPQALLVFLARMARNKAVDVVRQRKHTLKYNIACERPLGGPSADETDGIRAAGPTPSQVAMAQERWEQLLEALPGPYRLLLVLLRRGDTQREAALALGLNERTVSRALRKLQQLLDPERPALPCRGACG